MIYILQTKNGELESEEYLLKKVLDKYPNKHRHSYILSESSIKVEGLTDNQIADAIPIGKIDFVTQHLKEFRDIEVMIPIEVPYILQTPEFLKRNYEIITKESIPVNKHIFLKHIDKLKSFTNMFYNIHCPNEFSKENGFPDGKYVVSEVIEIQSEYRVIVLNNKIIHIGWYDGNPLVFPDVNLLQKAINVYSTIPHPNAYTLDIAVTQKGTCILEIHSFASVGNYGYIWDELPLLYQYGYEYYAKNSNFYPYQEYN